MWRVSKQSHTWYALEFSDLDAEMDNIKELLEGGDVVILGTDLESIRSEIEPEDDIVIVDPDE